MDKQKRKAFALVEREIEKILVHLYDQKLICHKEGTISKIILQSQLCVLQEKELISRVLDPQKIGDQLNQHNFLLDIPKSHGLYKFDLLKLENLSALSKIETGLPSFIRDFPSGKAEFEFQHQPGEATGKTFSVELIYDKSWQWVNLALKNICPFALFVHEVHLFNGNGTDLIGLRARILKRTVKREEQIYLTVNFLNFSNKDGEYSVEITIQARFQALRISRRTEKYRLQVRPKEVTEKQRQLMLGTDTWTKTKDLAYRPRLFFRKFIQNNYEVKNLNDLSPVDTQILQTITCMINKQLTLENYVEILQIFIELESSFNEVTCSEGTLKSKSILCKETDVGKPIYYVTYKDSKEISSKIKENDLVYVFESPEDGEINIHRGRKLLVEDRIKCFVKSTDAGRIYFCTLLKYNEAPFNSKKKYSLEFCEDNISFMMEQEALMTLQSRIINKVLFPEVASSLLNQTLNSDQIVNSSESENFTLSNEAINSEQIDTVKHILAKTALPAPYVLFGPPGTGKTSTLVEAITQIWSQKPHDHILVCTSSNYACDEIAIRLLRYVSSDDILRIYSTALERKLDTIHDDLLDVSNLIDRNFKAPEPDLICCYKIVLCTLITAGRISLSGVPKGHFSYIFIDECGSATEPSALIPISGFLSLEKTQLVIAGDPKQLGPVIDCQLAEELGLGKSLLERLMDLDLYKSMDPNVITKLVRNYRCHPAILKFPNDLFYDGDLLAEASAETTEFALMWPHLPNKKFPILFHAVKGRTRSEDNSFSLYNDLEVDTVVSYLRRLLGDKVNGRSLEQKEIGVISPYRKQCLRICDALSRFGWKEIDVGSVEQFQGQERSVVIISTVRSNTVTVGFLNNPKRLNVSLTRAKALLIVVGNPETLQMDPNWRKFIEFCKTNGACTGGDFKLKDHYDRKPKENQDLRKLQELLANLHF